MTGSNLPFKRTTRALWIVVWLIAFVNLLASIGLRSFLHDASRALAAEDRLGISHVQPASGPFVPLPDGTYMVPYSQSIPGTKVKFEMIPIPGGRFEMGSPKSETNRKEDEGPQVEISMEPFWMGKYEVTWNEYKKYMAMENVYGRLHQKGLRNPSPDEIDNPDVVTAPSSIYDPGFTFDAGDEPNQAAATMSQFAAKQYTKWLSLLVDIDYRLPFEAEWEYACRAGTSTPYYFGDNPAELKEYAWIYENSDELRHQVGQKKANPWGLHDMYGNVAEWVLDQYSATGYQHIQGQSISAADSFNKPTKLHPRVARGGHFLSEPEECRSASRLGSDERWRDTDPDITKSPWWLTDEPATGVGFRLIRPLNKIDRKAMEPLWSSDFDQLRDEVKRRIEIEGRGFWGTVDPSLSKDIEKFQDDD